MNSIYLMGRCRGIVRFNWLAFAEAEKGLVWRGWQVLNPHSLDIEAGFDVFAYNPADHGLTWLDYPPNFDIPACLARNKRNVAEADAVFILATGLGANGLVELETALNMGKLIYFEHNGFPRPQVTG